MKRGHGWPGTWPSVITPVLIFALGHAPAPADHGVIEWKSGPQASARQDPRDIAHTLNAVTTAGDQHVLIQFEQTPTQSTRHAVTDAGLRLLRYVNDHAYFAAIHPTGVDTDALTSLAAIRCILPIEPHWKLHPRILTGDVPPWALVAPIKRNGHSSPKEHVVVFVILHADVSTTRGQHAIRRIGGRVHNTIAAINGLIAELPAGTLLDLASDDAVQWLEWPLPHWHGLNDDVRWRVGADTLADPPYNLTGTGISVLLYDVGTANPTHEDFGSRLIVRDTSGQRDHATHVAGTIGGNGSGSSGVYRGMAPGVTLESYGFEMEGGIQPGFLYSDPGDLEQDYANAITSHAVAIANNSIGSNVAANGFPCDWEGDYGVTAALIDTIVRGDGPNPAFETPFRVVWAAGNERSSGRCGTTYGTLAPPASNKNAIVVGALYSDEDTVTEGSSWGPTDDGRLKPDLCAPGCQNSADFGVTSCSQSGGYGVYCSTSSACATVTGVSALLLEDWRALYPEAADPPNALLKAWLVHTAEDVNMPGPDYATGYGSVRAVAAVDLLRSGNWLTGEITHGETTSILAIVEPDEDELRVTLSWDDVPAAPNADPVLVNDLDVRVIGPDETVYRPWTLNPDNPAEPAGQTQADHRNNLEQVVVTSPPSGTYRIEIEGFDVPDGPQTYTLCATPALLTCTSTGTLSLDRGAYGCQDAILARVVDCDLNVDPDVIDTAYVTVTSDTEPPGELVVLSEVSTDAGIFTGTVILDSVDAVGTLWVTEDDQLIATYIDADDGEGGANVEVTATASIDCTPPVISNVLAIVTGPDEAVISFETDEPARGTVYYGSACAALDAEVGGEERTTLHALALTALPPDAATYFTLAAEDEAGNVAVDDNDGVCHVFETLPQMDYFTEVFIADRDLENVSLLFTPNGSGDLYAVCLFPSGQVPTDPDGGTELLLTDDDFAEITLGEQTVSLYGVAYDTLYVGSNGYLTFAAGDDDGFETLADHFDLPRVSALFDDLNPADGGTVSYKVLDDRVAVTWEYVPEFDATGTNTFQIELHFDGRILIAFEEVTAIDGITGLSAGAGLPPDFGESDLSAATSCGAQPPIAEDVEAATPYNQPALVTLTASDDGLPDPPGALSYTITSLPAHGELHDPGAGIIIDYYLPYTLVNGGDTVQYTPDLYYGGTDTFDFRAHDGGEPPLGGDSNIATASVVVGALELMYGFSLDEDPGWTVEGAWAFGPPTGGGSHNGDPTGGHTGDFVYGYNLAGDYPNNMTETVWLTMPELDCTAYQNIELRYWRWLGVDNGQWDHAYVQVSRDGETWGTVWNHAGVALHDDEWVQITHDISFIADGQETIIIRWGLGPTDETITYPGWNIDDIELWGEVPVLRYGDLDCDYDVDFDDIQPFIKALSGQEEYETAYPNCEWLHGDCDEDGDVDFDDIAAFVGKLT